MAIILSVANQKGGVGKTTTAVNLSAALKTIKKRVLLVDIDPQGNATMGCGIDKYRLKNSVCELLLGECSIEDAITHSDKTKIDVIPANTDLITAEIALIKNKHSEYILKEALAQVDDQYDYVIIDCPPSLNMLTINAFTASKGIIIPMQCEYYALEGLSALIQTIEKIQLTTNPNLKITGLVRTMYDTRNNLSNEVSVQLQQYFAQKVFKTIIPRNVKLAEAPSFGQAAINYARSSKGAISYVSLASEVIRKTKILLN
ncbi:Chromosome (plasmid) partitioning protein ParA [uncultured Gammaproteobacteria bacterium]|nr:Chromosome (plasmid) partitioning protein ParA [Bathymodiolus brooksi thiotrophic gill symbiont]CAC9551109.1 Chromosome (plasmid) partitioning protein ParA [uncultured Gammaproteobacteria bacterium]CAC9558762.1 Chromosome (plasmid) partitioning protein ParA [uncultured Gammaproteobacteria bacterium]CAC9563450.1 Chromosome (plasmid) partitioning protein ParA [uncultured Gammaproteobacteria bacterium]CAC9566232.1 Chromosome (plasmid) partitioning protein ParA [uncultured Gammaproteobacteria ba